jgi:hypothetical protein
MNGTNTKNIGIYDADINKEVVVNGMIVKAKGKSAPTDTITKKGITVFFGEHYKDTAILQDQLCVAFIDASKDGVTELRGVGYGKETISVDIH